jgi:hypothetical protein
VADETVNWARRFRLFVTPAKAGVQFLFLRFAHWIPAFAGMTEIGKR